MTEGKPPALVKFDRPANAIPQPDRAMVEESISQTLADTRPKGEVWSVMHFAPQDEDSYTVEFSFGGKAVRLKLTATGLKAATVREVVAALLHEHWPQ